MSKLKQHLERANSSPFSADKVEFIRKAKDRTYYGYTFDQASGRHPLSLALDFFLKDGSRFGVYYMEINSPILLSLGSGTEPQSVTLRTSSNEIVIAGRNLTPVYEFLLEQRLVWLKELETSFAEVADGETVIERIELKVS